MKAMGLALFLVTVEALSPHSRSGNMAVVGTPSNGGRGLAEVWSHLLQDTEKVFDNVLPGSECSGCAEAARLQQLRLHAVQNQILMKLRMKAPPVLGGAGVAALPAPVAAGRTLLPPPHAHHHIIVNQEDEEEDQHADDFYGKTDQKIIFPDDDSRLGKCDMNRHPTACFSFSMPGDLEADDVSSAEIWMYKEPDMLDGFKQTFVVSEAAHWDHTRLYSKTRPVAIVETDIKEGWLKAEVGWACGSWLEQGKGSLAVSCPSCSSPHHLRRPVALVGAKRPFLVINTKHSAKKRRARQLECTEGVSECCRERLYVSFSDIGWSDWILHPSGYHAYFCRGACHTVAAVTLGGSHHQSVLKKLFHGSGSRRVELKPCCTPTTFSPLQLFYRDSNLTVTQATLPNMIVESCGCM